MQGDEASLSRQTALSLVILAVAQSALLLLLHKALIHEFWPATDPRWLYAAYTVFAGVPLFFYLGLQQWNDRANGPAALVMAVVLFWLGWHAGWVAMPYADANGEQAAVIAQLIAVGLLLVFMGAFLFRGWREVDSWRQAPRLFLSRSWDNALTLGFLHLFLLVFCLLLVLWAALFDLIGIDFFKELFTTPEFVYPVTGLVGGLGLVIIRRRVSLISSVRYMCEALIRALLPLAAVIVLAFLLALPFTGLEPLWDTGFGTLLLMLISAMILFAFNADFGGGRSLSYPRGLDWLVRAAVAVLPVNLALAGWGLWLRVDQYGWSLTRYWALFIILVLAAFALAYLANMIMAATRRKSLNYRTLEDWNAGLAIGLMLALLLVNTGVLDFRKLAAADQLDRLRGDALTAEDFDAVYLRFTLGHYGQRALIELRDEMAANDPDLSERIQRVLDQPHRWSRPDPSDIPEEDSRLRAQFEIDNDAATPTELLRALLEDCTTRRHCLDARPRCRIIPLEIDGDAGWALTKVVNKQWMTHSRLILPGETDSQWLDVGKLGEAQCPTRWTAEQDESVTALATERAPFLRVGPCAYPLQFYLDSRPIP
jgi:hypothetical protein